MASMKRKLKKILARCRYDIRNNFYWFPKRNEYLNNEYLKEREKFIFQYISKHAQKRLNERFLFRGYTIDDVKNDIRNCDKRERHWNWCTKITGKLWAYIISNEAKVLVTVI